MEKKDFKYNEKTESFEYKIPNNEVFRNCKIVTSPKDFLTDGGVNLQ